LFLEYLALRKIEQGQLGISNGMKETTSYTLTHGRIGIHCGIQWMRNLTLQENDEI